MATPKPEPSELLQTQDLSAGSPLGCEYLQTFGRGACYEGSQGKRCCLPQQSSGESTWLKVGSRAAGVVKEPCFLNTLNTYCSGLL